jgi:hypothetical protein
MPPEQRRAFLKGMAVGAEAVAGEPLRQLMAALQPEERRQLRQRVGAMSEEQRRELRAHMHGLAPEQRVELARRVIGAVDDAAMRRLLDTAASSGGG